MDTYLIKIDGMYFAGMKSTEIGTAPTGGWYDEGEDIKGVLLAMEQKQAKLIEGNINLKSYFNKIYDAIRYGDLKFNKLEIEKVETE